MSSGLCKYRDMFGKPAEGVHQYRLFGVAIIDVAMTVVFAVLIAYWTRTPLWITLVVLFGAGIIAHRAFCVRTATDTLFFPDKKEAASKKINASYFI